MGHLGLALCTPLGQVFPPSLLGGRELLKFLLLRTPTLFLFGPRRLGPVFTRVPLRQFLADLCPRLFE